jgi:uncharacterized surface protein with fasciclin (FAS1) repeats
MRLNIHFNSVRPFPTIAGIVGLGVAGLFTLSGTAVRAQTSPAPAQSPSQIEQPGNTSSPSANTLSNSENQSPTELLQQLSQAGSFNTLAQAVEAAGLSGALQNSGGRYTILAPTDEAFAELPQGTLEQLLRPENQGLLRQVLSYHVIPTELPSNQLNTGGVDTLGGGIAVRVTPDRIIVNDGSVIRSDIQTRNGIVHVVNRVLMPSELRQQIISLQ